MYHVVLIHSVDTKQSPVHAPYIIHTAPPHCTPPHPLAPSPPHHSWLNKLDVVKRVLVDNSWEKRPDTEALAYAYIYMQWIATGAIPCVEGGGHYRPNHHAELAQVVLFVV